MPPSIFNGTNPDIFNGTNSEIILIIIIIF